MSRTALQPFLSRFGIVLVVLVLSVLAACGGGGSGGAPVGTPTGDASSDRPGSDDPTDDPAGTPPEAETRDIFFASRFASRTTFGATLDTLEAIEASGAEAWLEAQFQTPLTSHDALVDSLLQRDAAGEFADSGDNDNWPALFGRLAWWHVTVTAQDQLRQRVAYALSQVFVISDTVDDLLAATHGTSNFYDTLLSHAFGNYRDLLRAVTLHPAMGVYLSHLNNARARPERGTFPDENYAREAMQLFSIGLFELHPDGSEKRDDNGQPIPSYDNDDIREFAKIYTGLSWGGLNDRFGSQRPNFRVPMQMFDEYHEPEQKQLLRGQIVPAGQSGIADIDAAVDNLFNHPNVGPFFGRQLIQRLVTSNPSPAYISRVSAAFADNGSGVRGDMRAVLRAILFDPEAMADPDPQSNFGKLREPLLRFTAMLRQLGVESPDGFYANLGYVVQKFVQQHPLSAPSVFNFYLPGYQPVGEIGEQQLVAPEFQITNSNTIIELSNLLRIAVVGDFVNDLSEAPFAKATLTLDGLLPLAGEPNALLDRLDLLFTYGTLSEDTRLAITELATLIDDPELRVRVAAYLLLISPDYAVEI